MSRLSEALTRSGYASGCSQARRLYTVRLRISQAVEAEYRGSKRLDLTDEQAIALYPRVADAARAAEYFKLPESRFRRGRSKLAQPQFSDPREHREETPEVFLGRLAWRLRDAAYGAVKSEFVADVCRELAWSEERGWPALFGTLTVKPERQWFFQDPKHWREWSRKFERAVNHHNSVASDRDPGALRYIAICEWGKRADHLHLHLVAAAPWFPYLQCPIRNGGRRHFREVSEPYPWEHGFAQWIPIRYSETDAFGRRGFMWPHQFRTEDGQPLGAADAAMRGISCEPMPVGCPRQVGAYVGKYLDKSSQRGENPWKGRRKGKRTFGKELVKNLFSDRQFRSRCLRWPSRAARNLKLRKSTVERYLTQCERETLSETALIELAVSLNKTPSIWDIATSIATTRTTLPPRSTMKSSCPAVGFDPDAVLAELENELDYEAHEYDAAFWSDVERIDPVAHRICRELL